ncbi:MAG: 50S ribosomal protein L11 methyltransferase [Flavobacteriales bacterium]
MNWTEVSFLIAPLEPWREILLVELADRGFDTFEETPHGLKAYIPSERFDRSMLHNVLVLRDPHVHVSHTVHEVPHRNWNEEWERSFQPVEVGKAVRIRAEFHPHVEGFDEEIVITPRMAFGTGHHATTRMMVEAMLALDLRGQDVCDLGCGTAVLAILAERRGARSVFAVDIDEHAVLNARENLRLNGCHAVVVEKGDVRLLRPASYGVILANIERNTLLRDMAAMRDALLPGGALLLSGFIQRDRDVMVQAVKDAGLSPAENLAQGEWALIGCRK